MVVIESLSSSGLVASIIGIGAILIALVLKRERLRRVRSQHAHQRPRGRTANHRGWHDRGVGVTMVAALVPAASRQGSTGGGDANDRDDCRGPWDVASAPVPLSPVSDLYADGRTGALSFDNAISVVGFGALITFVGVSLLSPRSSPAPLHSGRGRRSRLGPVGRLARGNAMRQPRRTASTASALMIGVALVTVIAVFSASAKSAVASVLRNTFSTDFQVRIEGFVDPTLPDSRPH